MLSTSLNHLPTVQVARQMKIPLEIAARRFFRVRNFVLDFLF